jgi:hypothetical protein
MDEEFTVYSLTDLMTKNGVEFEAETPAFSVNDVLRKLVKREQLRVSRSGSGSSPNYYRRAKLDQQEQLLKVP